MRPPSSWTDARGARKCVGVSRGDVLPSPARFLKPATQHTISQPASTLVYFRVLAIRHKRGTLCSFGQGTNTGLPSEKRLDAVLGQVYLHSWCPIVVRQGGKARPLRRVVADLYPLFHERLVQGLTGWDLRYQQLILCVTFPFLRSYQVLVWHHCHQVIASFSARQSRPLPFFPSWMYLLDGDDNCMLSMPFSTSDLHFAVGRVAKIARRWLPELLCYLATHCGFLLKTSALLSALSCCLAHALSTPRFPSFWPDTASFRSCLLLPPGFLGTREAGICAGSRAWSSFSFSSICSAHDGMCPVVSSSQ